jgi:hypothetical protein
MLSKKEKEHNDLVKANSVLKKEIENKMARKNLLLKSRIITPSISKEIDDINRIVDKKSKQLRKNIKKIESFERI